jgi:CheY-like chemotaxis protein
MSTTLREAPVVTHAPREDRVNILLVDDRAENLLALEAILEPLGERLIRAHSGDAALKCLLTEEFAVILLDVQMPGLNGFETAELIKSRERTRYVPIIFLTAISKDEAYVFRGYSVGAVDYMSKPFQPDVLRSKVAVFVDVYRKQHQLKRQEQMLHEAALREIELEHRSLLLAQEARTTQIVSTAMDAIIVLDADRRITVFNTAAERVFGRSARTVIKQPVTELISGGDLSCTPCRVPARMVNGFRSRRPSRVSMLVASAASPSSRATSPIEFARKKRCVRRRSRSRRTRRSCASSTTRCRRVRRSSSAR